MHKRNVLFLIAMTSLVFLFGIVIWGSVVYRDLSLEQQALEITAGVSRGAVVGELFR